MVKTVLEVIVDRNTKDIDHISLGMENMLSAINGLRQDLAIRDAGLISMINAQNTMLMKIYTDHEASDLIRFSDVKSRMNYFLGATAVASPIFFIAAQYFIGNR